MLHLMGPSMLGDAGWRLPDGVPIIIEGDSNTAWGFDALNWSKTMLALSGMRVWLPPGGHMANGGSTVANSLSENSMNHRLATAVSILNQYPGPKIVWFQIGTNAEAGQLASYPATAELAVIVAAYRAAGAIVVANTTPYNTDNGNQTRIDALNAWLRTPGNVDYVHDVNPAIVQNMGAPQTHYSRAQHLAVGASAARLLARIVRPGESYNQLAPIFNTPIGGFASASGTGFTGNFPSGWTPARTTGDGTMTGSETTQLGRPAVSIACTAGASNTTFRLRRTISLSRGSGTVLDAMARIALAASSAATVPYLGFQIAGIGPWPNTLLGGLDVPIAEWGGPLIYRPWVVPLSTSVTSVDLDLTVTIAAGQSATIVMSEPMLFERAASAGTAPVALTAPVMATCTVGGTPSHTAGTYSGSPTPSVSFSYYMAGEAISNNYVFQAGDAGKAVYVLENAGNAFGNTSQQSANVSVQAAASTVTWDATLSSGTPAQLTYSNGNATVSTNANTGGIRYARASTTTGKTSGKWFVRFALSGTTGTRGVGLGTSTVGGSNAVTGGTVGTQRFWWSGASLLTGVTTAMGTNISTNNGSYELAWDASADLIWVRLAGGSWNNNASADPASGTGGISTSGRAGAALMPICGLPNVTTTSSAAIESGTPPSGFTQWN